MQRIGVFGGTFDPVHFGHLRTALEVKQGARLDDLRFVPCARPPHRGPPLVAPAQRLRMLELAVADEGGFSIDQRELSRPGHSYTVDTLASLRSELGRAALCLIIGMDAFEGFHRWHRWPDILEQAHLIVAHRPGASRPVSNPQAELLAERLLVDSSELDGRLEGSILMQPVTQLDISATALRRAVADGQSIRYLTPEPVRRYIEERGLYAGPNTQ